MFMLHSVIGSRSTLVCREGIVIKRQGLFSSWRLWERLQGILRLTVY